tara:strand:+ start:941 stop:1216 length:276 start_codon:yes stop_codon:yes gene_type:complete
MTEEIKRTEVNLKSALIKLRGLLVAEIECKTENFNHMINKGSDEIIDKTHKFISERKDIKGDILEIDGILQAMNRDEAMKEAPDNNETEGT